jgi:hypothetical protein
MLQELRDYWLPLMLFIGTLLAAAILLVLVAVMPAIVEYFDVSQAFLVLFADDVVVRRSSIAGAIGLIVTAFVFFRPIKSRNISTEKPQRDTMAGA